MQRTCSHCRRVLEFAGEAPRFCGFCGQALTVTTEQATAEFEPAAESVSAAATLPPDPTRRPTGAPPDAPGRQIAGYRLVRELGRGGMGVVWEAEQLGSGRRVALKLLAPGRDHAPEALERFLREGRLAAALSHPRTTFVFEAGAHQGQPFITMELMPGATLADRCSESGPLPVARAVDTILDVIDGLEAAHAAGVIHRDVKPSNCFLDAGGRVKVGDFGLSKSLVNDAALTRTGAFMGTPLFAAPEQVRGGQVDERTDVYAVGATLYYLIAGRGPFDGDATAVIAQIVSDPAPPLRSVCPAVPKDLDRAIARTLEKDPARRFATMDQLCQALLPFASASLIPAPLGRRLAAYFIDSMIVGMVVGVVAFFVIVATSALMMARRHEMTEISATWVMGIEHAIFSAVLVYYILTEGLTGRSLGKRWLGLRVVAADGGRPGLRRATLRALLMPGLIWLGLALLLPLLYPADQPLRPTVNQKDMLKQQLLSPLMLLPVMVCLVTMRARNGYRGLHDLASGTRVVMLRPAATGVRGFEPPVRRPRPLADGPRAYGPFQAKGVLGRCGEATVYEARDESLSRRVWVFARRRDTAPIPADRAQVARVTRPRWLQGGETADERWDAFESVRGAPLSRLGKLPWDHGRLILRDLAAELAAGTADGTLPRELSLDQVWLDRDGRVKLLDAPLEVGDTAVAVPTRPMALLRDAAEICARGPALPLHARDYLAELAARPDNADSLTWAADQLQQIAARPATVRHSDRLVAMGISAGVEYSAYQIVLCLLAVALLQLPGMSLLVNAVAVAVAALAAPAVVGYWTRGGPVFRLVGLAVRRADGLPASRLRGAARNVAAWCVILLGVVLNIVVLPALMRHDPTEFHVPDPGQPPMALQPLFLALSCGVMLLSLLTVAGTIYAVARPERGLQDYLAGTRLVPR
ncbi:MAG: protein kinase domain-containing protein [Gemmataceae bacterium]